MVDNHPHLMLLILRREYPEIASIISERIKKTLPEETLTDYNWIDKVVYSFSKAKSLNAVSWMNNPGTKMTEHREMLVAVLLMFFHPERILCLSRGNTRKGLVKSIATALKCKKATISKSVAGSVSSFKNYKAFKEEVYRLYEHIKTEQKIFIN